MEAKQNKKDKKQQKPPVTKGPINEKTLIFGENLKLARKERGFTAEVLSRFLEISTAYVGLIERGERCPSLVTFIRICDFFGESYEDMLTAKSALSVEEEKLLDSGADTKDQVERKRKMLTSMINTFGLDELEYVIGIVKGLKHYNLSKKEGGFDFDAAFDIDPNGNE